MKARIKAIMRRAGSDHEEKEKAKSIEVGDLRMDCEGRRVFIAGREINLTAKEFDVLELLVFNPNKVYSRENLLNIVWGYEYPGDVRKWMYISAASARRLKPIRVSRNTCTPNGAWDIISRHNKI